MGERVRYGGRYYYRYPESERPSDRAYFRRSSGGKSRLLHRDVWEDAHGPIPDGCEVHHKDRDPGNNVLDNLECLPPGDHRAEHPYSAERLGRQREHLDRIRPLTKEWHASDVGRAKHREVGALAYRGFVADPKPCGHCGGIFTPGALGNRDRFCSDACKAANRRASGVDDETRRCASCGGEFRANRYSKTRCCSRLLHNRRRNRRRSSPSRPCSRPRRRRRPSRSIRGKGCSQRPATSPKPRASPPRSTAATTTARSTPSC
jgi:hypothetical protein